MPKMNGNTPLFVAAGIVVLVVICITILSFVGNQTPDIFTQILVWLIGFIVVGSGAAAAVAVTKKAQEEPPDDSKKGK